MAFNIKNYNVDTTPVSRLEKLSERYLAKVLDKWSRIGNQRAYRMSKIDSMYSSILTFKRGGRFGKSGTYLNKETMLNELVRIKSIAPNLKKAKVEQEAQEMKGLYDAVLPNSEKISMDKFRTSFAMFKSKHGYIPTEIYNKIKEAITRMHDRENLYDIENIIEKLYDEFMIQAAEKLYTDNLNSDLPW